MTTLYVKNMVCERCVKVVREELTATNYTVKLIELGRVVLTEDFTGSDFKVARLVLERNGFELLDNEEQRLVEKIKNLVIQHIRGQHEKAGSQNFSEYLSDEIGVNYFKLSKLFSTTEGLTIEKYIIHQKIEKAKELLLYGEQTLGEIAFELDYSSTAHLSGQFKTIVGLTPTDFKKNGLGYRKPLDEI